MARSARLDLAVVGGGVIGLSTALAGQDRGLEVRCFEGARPGAGQSAGRNRIFRHRHDQRELVALAVRARRAWEQWEERFGLALVGEEGVLVAGAGIEEHAARFEEAGVAYREVGPAEQRSALAVLGSLGETALLDVRGGSIRIGQVVEALAGRMGDRLVLGEVLGLCPDGDGVEVHAAEGIWRARHVVICAGAGTAKLARALGLELPLRNGCLLRATYAARVGIAAERWACLLDRRETAASGVYASQCEGRALYAVGLHSSEVALEAAEAPMPAEASLAPAAARTSGYVAETLPGLDPKPLELRLCRTTKLPSSDDAFGAWALGPVTVFAGHNVFKFAPVLGPLLIDAATAAAIPPELSLAPETQPQGPRSVNGHPSPPDEAVTVPTEA